LVSLALESRELLACATAPEGDRAPMPRALLVFAHPDDETVALGARIGRFHGAHFILVTDGAPRNQADSRSHGFPSWVEYREARSRELTAMFRLAGLGQMSRERLEIPDQEASFRLAELTRRLAHSIRTFRPEIVFTHPYEGGHPDHDACAFAVSHACALAAGDSGAQPLIVECAFYHAGPNVMETEAFLPSEAPPPEMIHALSPREQSRKRERMACFVTQRTTLAQFACETERFRIAPQYDFTRPPHAGPTFYDHFPWGMTSGRFCQLAEEAARELRKEVARA
jgi:LmbE family N-acetylglucosaminyl deacetylase